MHYAPYNVEALSKFPLDVLSAVIFDLICDFTDGEDMQSVLLLFDFEYLILSLKLILLLKGPI